MRDPIEAHCDPRFHAVKTQGKRPPGTPVKWIVLHDEEASTAESAARFFTTPLAGGSAHLCVDGDTCFRCVPNNMIAEGAPGANMNGFHIEQAGFAKWSTTTWLLHRDTLRRAAYKAALHAVVVFDVPVRFVDADDLRLLKPGITTHREVSKAFGGDHTDPGPFWPRRLFMRYVREYAAELER